MKSIILFGTKLYVYLIEIPVITVLLLAIRFNEGAENLTKLYPLQIFCSLVIIFIVLYFFRAVSISNAKIKQIGLFSSRDSSMIKKGKTLVLTMLPYRKLKVELFELQEHPVLEWVVDKDFVPIETNVFRERAIGGYGAVKRKLKFFGATSEQINSLFNTDDYKTEGLDVDFSTEIFKSKKRFKIKFNKTI